MKRSVIYCRISLDKPNLQRDTLTDQEKRCREQSHILDSKVVKVYREIVEGDATDRLELLSLESYLDLNSNKVDYLIIKHGKRFARSVEIATGLVGILRKYSIELVDCTFPLLRGEASYNNFLKLAAEGKAEKLNISRKTKQAINERKEEGKHWGRHPAGFSLNHDIIRGTIFSPDKFKVGIYRMFILASQGHQIKEIRSQLRAEGYGDIPTSTISYRLRNKSYCGYVKDTKKNLWHKGIHEAIITEKLFNDVQKLLTDKKKRSIRREKTQKNEVLPLRNWLLCKKCKHTFTGSRIYYRCNYCKISKKMEDLHKEFINLLNTFDYVYDSAKGHIIGYLKYFHAFIIELRTKETEINHKNQLIKSKIDNLDKQYLKADNVDLNNIYKEERIKLDNLIKENNARINQIPYLSSLIYYMFEDYQAVKNFGDSWEKESFENKHAFMKDIFPEGIYYDGSKFEVIKVSSVYKKRYMNEKSNLEKINETFVEMRSKLKDVIKDSIEIPENKEILDELFNEISYRIRKED